jgi:hypothetical protein
MKIFIFANCQGQGIKNVLDYLNIDNFVINFIHNYEYIHDKYMSIQIIELLKNCDILIYQPFSEKNNEVYNIENYKKYMKDNSINISFPNIYFNAAVPFGIYSSVPNEFKFYNHEIILNLKLQGKTLDDIYYMYDNNLINFNYEERFNYSINYLYEREKYLDIKITDFIRNNIKKYELFYTHYDKFDFIFFNHPSITLIIECVKQILKILNIDKTIENYNGPIHPGGYQIVSNYDLNYYNFEWCTSKTEHSDIIFKKMIEKIYNS